ncbi:MAG: SIS domain-containing protein [PVC group bacterium]
MEEKILSSLREAAGVINRLEAQVPLLAAGARMVIGCLKGGGKILLCGNGGSAADSQHIAAELVGRFRRERRALPAISLSTDTSILTALANDYSFDSVFSRQVEALGRPGDLLLVISTSGNSRNLLRAVRAAKAGGLGTLALLGKDGGKVAGEVDLAVIVPSSDTARIQEAQAVIYHGICDLAEEAFSG